MGRVGLFRWVLLITLACGTEAGEDSGTAEDDGSGGSGGSSSSSDGSGSSSGGDPGAVAECITGLGPLDQCSGDLPATCDQCDGADSSCERVIWGGAVLRDIEPGGPLAPGINAFGVDDFPVFQCSVSCSVDADCDGLDVNDGETSFFVRGQDWRCGDGGFCEVFAFTQGDSCEFCVGACRGIPGCNCDDVC
ncbi:MAG: hypothetical protein ACFB9M_20205 [Myxococcota bacterium]